MTLDRGPRTLVTGASMALLAVLILSALAIMMRLLAVSGTNTNTGSSHSDVLLMRIDALTREVRALRGSSHRIDGGRDAGGAEPSRSNRLNSLALENRNGQSVGLYLPFDDERVRIREVNLTTTYTEGGQVKKMNIFVMATSTTPPFAAAVAHPQYEAASKDLFQNGDMEKPTRRLFEFLLKEKCASGRANGAPPLVLDAGANLGYFSTYSAYMGCDVVSVEMQPRLIPIIKMGPTVNGISDRSTVFNNIIHTDPNARVGISYANGMCWGCSAVHPLSNGAKVPAGQDEIKAIRLDSLVSKDVLLMKVDIEGFEVLGIESAMGIIEKYDVSNILVEWAPVRWQHEQVRGTQLLEKLYDLGYIIRHYDMRFNLPQEMVTVEQWDIFGRTFRLERDQLGLMNKWLIEHRGRGEANLWLSKKYPVKA